jgi:hypothetical protein
MATLAVALVSPMASVAQDFPDSDTREINSYVLTESGLAKYAKASKSLAALQKQSGDCEDAESAGSLDEMVAHFNAIPGARAAISSAGMTTREFVVFTWSLFQNGMAAWALSQPGGKLPAGTSMENVNFYRAHEAAMQGLSKYAEFDDCDDGGDEEEPESAG